MVDCCKMSSNATITKQQMNRIPVPHVKVKDRLVLGDRTISKLNINRIIMCSYENATISDITRLLPEVLVKHQGVKQLIFSVLGPLRC